MAASLPYDELDPVFTLSIGGGAPVRWSSVGVAPFLHIWPLRADIVRGCSVQLTLVSAEPFDIMIQILHKSDWNMKHVGADVMSKSEADHYDSTFFESSKSCHKHKNMM